MSVRHVSPSARIAASRKFVIITAKNTRNSNYLNANCIFVYNRLLSTIYGCKLFMSIILCIFALSKHNDRRHCDWNYHLMEMKIMNSDVKMLASARKLFVYLSNNNDDSMLKVGWMVLNLEVSENYSNILNHNDLKIYCNIWHDLAGNQHYKLQEIK